jgi:nicotinamidase-related amidase
MNKKTALLIIDVQVAMFTYEYMKLYDGERVLENIYALLQKARAADIPVIFIQHTSYGEDEYKKGSTTWQIHPRVAPLEGETVIEKTVWDAFHKTNLQETLQKLEITNLVTVGMQTEYCVDTTCRRAFSMGYENTLVKDAHSTFDSRVLTAEQIIQHHNNVLGARIVTLRETNEIEF